MYTSRYDDAMIAYGETLKKYKPFAELVQHIEVRKAMYVIQSCSFIHCFVTE